MLDHPPFFANTTGITFFNKPFAFFGSKGFFVIKNCFWRFWSLKKLPITKSLTLEQLSIINPSPTESRNGTIHTVIFMKM
jgi:hypothetical protein